MATGFANAFSSGPTPIGAPNYVSNAMGGFQSLLSRINPTVDPVPSVPLVHEPTPEEIEIARRRALLQSGYDKLSWRGPYDEPEPVVEEPSSGLGWGAGFLGGISVDTSEADSAMIRRAVRPEDSSERGGGQYAGMYAGDFMVVDQRMGEGDTERRVVPRPGTVTHRRLQAQMDRSCFIADTLIRMADGTVKAIVDVSIGETVKGMTGEARVIGKQIVSLCGRNLCSFETQIPDGPTAGWFTYEHPFYSERGWVAIDGSVTGAPYFHGHVKEGEIKDVRINDVLQTETGTHGVDTIVELEAPEQNLYQLMLEDGTETTDGHRSYYAGQREDLLFAVMD